MNRRRLPTGIQTFREVRFNRMNKHGVAPVCRVWMQSAAITNKSKAGLHHDLAYCCVLSRRSIWL